MYTKHNHRVVGQIPEFFGESFHTKNKLAVKSNNGFEITWQQLNRRSNQVARIMSEDYSLQKNDKVLTFLVNCGEYPEIIYGLAKMGIVVAPISYRFVSRELKYAIDHSDAKAIIISEELLETFYEIQEEVNISHDRILIIGSGKKANYEERIRTKDISTISAEVYEDDYFWMGFTGGTTGYPKAALTTHKTIIQNWEVITKEFRVLDDDYELIAGAFYHGLGFLYGLQQLNVGGSIYILDKFHPETVLSLIENEKITATPMVPTMYNDLITFESKEKFDVSSMRVLICAGSALLTKVKEGVINYFVNAGLYEYYGSTEHGLYTIMKPQDQMRKTRSCGIPIFGMEIKILDEDGNPVKEGEVGEVYKKGLLLGAEYYKNKQATEECFRGDWVSSGDMGYFDEEGFLYIVDRKKDMVISGGVNIFTTEIEEIILSHPEVIEVAVVGLPDEKWGEVLSAYIVSGNESLSSEDIKSYCEGKVSGYKKPKHVTFVESLPRTAAGKILKRELRDYQLSSSKN